MGISKNVYPRALLVGFCLLIPGMLPATDASPSKADQVVRNLNTPRDFPAITSVEQWQQRARNIREHILVSCGLWPLPQKTPLKPHIFGKIEHDGYSVEK